MKYDKATGNPPGARGYTREWTRAVIILGFSLGFATTAIRSITDADAAGGGGASFDPATQSAPSSWPDTEDWVPLKCGGQLAWDPIGDASCSNHTDIVGDSTYAGAFTFSDDSYLYIRLRLEGDLDGTNGAGFSLKPFGWGFGIDTDKDLSTIEFNYVLSGSGSSDVVKVTKGMEFNAAPIADEFDATNWYRLLIAGDGSDFDGNPTDSEPDYFLDFAVPLADLKNWTTDASVADSAFPAFSPGRIAIWLSTSANGETLNKDFLCSNDPNSGVDLSTISGAISDPVIIGKFLDPQTPPDGATLLSGTPTLTGYASGSVKITFLGSCPVEASPCEVTRPINSSGVWSYAVPASWGWTAGDTPQVKFELVADSLVNETFDYLLPNVDGDDDDCPDLLIADEFGKYCLGFIAPTTPPNGATLLSGTPTITGTASGDVKIRYVDGCPLVAPEVCEATATIDDDGNWSFDVPLEWGWDDEDNPEVIFELVDDDTINETFNYFLPNTDGDDSDCPEGQIGDDASEYCIDDPGTTGGGGGGGSTTGDSTGGDDGASAADPADTADTLGMTLTGSGCFGRENSSNGLPFVLWVASVTQLFSLAARRRRPWPAIPAAALASLLLAFPLLSPRQAKAEASGSIDAEQFEATVPGVGFLNQAYGTLEPTERGWSLGFMTMANWSPMKVVPVTDGDTRVGGPVVPLLLRQELGGMIRLGSSFDLTAAVPFASTLGEPTWLIGGRTEDQVVTSSLGDIRVSVGADLLRLAGLAALNGERIGPGLLFRLTGWIPGGGWISFHGEEQFRLQPQLIGEYRTESYRFGANLGYTFRSPSSIMNVVNDDAVRWGTFVIGPLGSAFSWMASLFGQVQSAPQLDPLDNTKVLSNTSNYSPMEFLVGAKTKYGDFDLSAAVGRGINAAAGAPSLRAVVQVGYLPSINPPKEVKLTGFKAVTDKTGCQSSASTSVNEETFNCCVNALKEEKFSNFCDDTILGWSSIEFDVDKSDIRASEEPKLELVKTLLNARPSIAHVKIYGHTDDDSGDVYNRNLSDQRAKAVMNWFIRMGLELERFSLLARGETMPVMPNSTPENKQRNRRATFRRGNPRF